MQISLEQGADRQHHLHSEPQRHLCCEANTQDRTRVLLLRGAWCLRGPPRRPRVHRSLCVRSGTTRSSDQSRATTSDQNTSRPPAVPSEWSRQRRGTRTSRTRRRCIHRGMLRKERSCVLDLVTDMRGGRWALPLPSTRSAGAELALAYTQISHHLVCVEKFTSPYMYMYLARHTRYRTRLACLFSFFLIRGTVQNGASLGSCSQAATWSSDGGRLLPSSRITVASTDHKSAQGTCSNGREPRRARCAASLLQSCEAV